jgi:hypothetical protein
MRAAVMLTALILAAGCRLGGPWPEEEIPELEYTSRDVAGIVQWVQDYLQVASDQGLYGVDDHWATPRESYAAGAGDCDDYVILALYLIERDLGIVGAMVTRYTITGRGHAWALVDGTEYEVTGAKPGELEGFGLSRTVVPWSRLRDILGI